MARFALLLRGVNVGRGNALPMAELRALLESAECTGVQTLLQSGNAVLESRRREAELVRAIEALLERRMGRQVATTVRTPAQLAAILATDPFRGQASDPARRCVTFLSEVPAASAVAPLASRDWSPERVQVVGREIHAWHPGGQARSPLVEAIARLPLRGTVTTRNWNTVVKLAGMLGP